MVMLVLARSQELGVEPHGGEERSKGMESTNVLPTVTVNVGTNTVLSPQSYAVSLLLRSLCF